MPFACLPDGRRRKLSLKRPSLLLYEAPHYDLNTMSRLASLHGPSIPSSNPVSPQSTSSPSSRRTPKRISSRASPAPESPQLAPAESPFHRKLRSTLRDIAGYVESWNELALGEGLRAAKGVVDNGTELDNALVTNADHRSFIATPKIRAINAHLKTLDGLPTKFNKLFRQIVASVDALESLVVSTAAARGPLFLQTPVWLTWTPENFLNAVLPLPRRYHQSLITMQECVVKLKDPDIAWEEGRDVVRAWAAQRELQAGGVQMGWKELNEVLEVEVRGWNDG
ncbi:hypothetical protein CALVIDRAFT_561291 [Calocera viscosa TUFC12733]|uniref:Uncharacterized protein n=1 Tax=Calocera viscosa (strain TUFC12733) TaxID=1330018 RepID=A0A167Q5E5_CALVF|nr:hypothetical protein CALVIDRAFT_561291 [Calocera viscosa TUFC12733]